MPNLEEHIIRLRDQFTGPLKNADTATDNFRSKIAGVGAAIGAAFAGLAVTAFVQDSVRAWDENEKAIGQVRAALESTGGVAGRTLKQLTDQATELQKKTLFGDEQILQQATAQLLTFKNIAGDTFDRAQMAAIDLSARMGGDLQSNTILLGKALNDPVNAIGALSRKGIQFTESQKDVVKSLVETNRLADAQAIILGELESQFGGSAEAAARAGAGPLQLLAMQFGEVKESIGGFIAGALLKLAPLLNSVLEKLIAFGDWFSRNLSTIQVVGGVIAGVAAAIAALMIPTAVVTGLTWLFTSAFAALNFVMAMNPITLIVIALGALVGAVVVAWKKFDGFRAGILGVWSVIKTVATNIVLTFTKLPVIIGDAFRAIPTAIAASFQNVGELIRAVLSGDFKAVPGILKDLLSNALKSNPLTAVGKNVFDSLGAGAGDAFSQAYNKEIDQAAADKKAGKSTPGPQMAGLNTPTGISVPTTAKAAQSAASGASGSGKNISISINKLVESLTIQTTNLSESTTEIKNAVTRALLAAVNDANIIEAG